MKLYFVRHAESEANVTNEFSNKNPTKHPLTAKGRAQAHALADQLRDVDFAAIYSSPLLRAVQTAQILNTHLHLEIHITDALREHDAGDLEGRADPEAWQQYADCIRTWYVERDLDARVPGGESFNELAARFMPFFSDLVEKYDGTDVNILLVTHGGILHLMLPLVTKNIDPEFSYTNILKNAALIITEQQLNNFFCLAWDGIELSPQRISS
ncbi:MAG TPA: histidine phosphatase family protein [Anaerolineae bacterium]|nr:histidine phosphatase family protein [Anaerolineae bacterium]